MNQNRKDTSMSQPERPPQPTYLRPVEPVDPVDPQLIIARDVFDEAMSHYVWDDIEVDPESPGVTLTDLAAVLARRLTGAEFAVSGAMVLNAHQAGEDVVLDVTTWGPLSQGRPRRVTHYLIKLGDELP